MHNICYLTFYSVKYLSEHLRIILKISACPSHPTNIFCHLYRACKKYLKFILTQKRNAHQTTPDPARPGQTRAGHNCRTHFKGAFAFLLNCNSFIRRPASDWVSSGIWNLMQLVQLENCIEFLAIKSLKLVVCCQSTD